MKVDKQLVEKLADLAKLNFTEAEKEKFVSEFRQILEFVERLNEVDTTGVEPLEYVSGLNNVLRKDEVQQEITHEEALRNAPVRDTDYFKVPKVIQKK